MDQGGVRCMNISGQNLFKDLDIVQSKVEVADQEQSRSPSRHDLGLGNDQ